MRPPVLATASRPAARAGVRGRARVAEAGPASARARWPRARHRMVARRPGSCGAADGRRRPDAAGVAPGGRRAPRPGGGRSEPARIRRAGRSGQSGAAAATAAGRASDMRPVCRCHGRRSTPGTGAPGCCRQRTWGRGQRAKSARGRWRCRVCTGWCRSGEPCGGRGHRERSGTCRAQEGCKGQQALARHTALGASRWWPGGCARTCPAWPVAYACAFPQGNRVRALACAGRPERHVVWHVERLGDSARHGGCSCRRCRRRCAACQHYHTRVLVCGHCRYCSGLTGTLEHEQCVDICAWHRNFEKRMHTYSRA